jgi:hypothetical protein
MRYAMEMASGNVIYILGFMKFGIGFQVVLRFCHKSLRRFNVDVTDKGFMKYAVVMASGNMIYIPSFINIG